MKSSEDQLQGSAEEGLEYQEHYLLGDIGGQLSVFEKALDQIEDAPAIQVGDMIRMNSQWRENNSILVEYMEELSNWIFLYGNHESVALGGPKPPGKIVEEKIDLEDVEKLRRLWESEGALAVSVDGVLISHGGLTAEYWRELGSPETSEKAAALINMNAGRPFSEWDVGGRLTGDFYVNPRTPWPAMEEELLTGWREEEEMPFHQIIGHAAPFKVFDEEYWPNVSYETLNTTELISEFGYARIDLMGKRVLSTDWTLGDITRTGEIPKVARVSQALEILEE